MKVFLDSFNLRVVCAISRVLQEPGDFRRPSHPKGGEGFGEAESPNRLKGGEAFDEVETKLTGARAGAEAVLKRRELAAGSPDYTALGLCGGRLALRGRHR